MLTYLFITVENLSKEWAKILKTISCIIHNNVYEKDEINIANKLT